MSEAAFAMMIVENPFAIRERGEGHVPLKAPLRKDMISAKCRHDHLLQFPMSAQHPDTAPIVVFQEIC